MHQIRVRRSAAILMVALLVAWGIFAPVFAYRFGHLAGYVKAVSDVVNRPLGVPATLPGRERLPVASVPHLAALAVDTLIGP